VSADLRRSDLEGCSLIGANLTRADLRDALLSAARFATVNHLGELDGAKITGLKWQGAAGLLEEQEQYLVSASAERKQ
jgi:uncharacterized protein YjbI with pentapeptide repeats